MLTSKKARSYFGESNDEIIVMSDIIYYWVDLMMFTLMIVGLVCWLFFNISYVCHQYFPSNVQALLSMPCQKLEISTVDISNKVWNFKIHIYATVTATSSCEIPFFYSHNMLAAKDHTIVPSNLSCRNLTDKLDGKGQSAKLW